MYTTIKAIKKALKDKVIVHYDGFNSSRKRFTIVDVKRGVRNYVMLLGHCGNRVIEQLYPESIVRTLMNKGSYSINAIVEGRSYIVTWDLMDEE
jgi:hypothetical protein